MMKVHPYTVVPWLPERLAPLAEMARNLYWSWDHDVLGLFRRLDPDLWEETGHNPVLVLGRCSQQQLADAARDEGFLAHLRRAHERYRDYLDRPSWFSNIRQDRGDVRIAYFSAEFGLTECLPNYSGGLGVLSGDHLKAASDLGLPLVGVGLLYQQGYFRQYLDASGWQQERYPEVDLANLPIRRVEDDEGRPLLIELKLAGRPTQVQTWRVDVGRVPLYLLDTNLPENEPPERDITDQLYGGDRETRIRQEIVLGIGGLRVLRMLGISPDVCHMNEGHSAFLALERVRLLIEEGGVGFGEAAAAASAGNVFTTHTPVPAGFDVFGDKLMKKYFPAYAADLGLDWERFMALGEAEALGGEAGFNMAMLAVSLSSRINGVSQLHAAVTRRMWHGLWPELPEDEVPVDPVTNGIHVGSWISEDMASLLDRYLGPQWREDPGAPEAFARVDDIPDEELWMMHERRRTRLVAYARRQLRQQLERRGAPESDLVLADEVLSPDALTIGFARRFATYKRSTLLLGDAERLIRLLGDPERPVQILFAGKAHPRDENGKKLIQELVRFAGREQVRRRMVFLEDYDLNTARNLVQGVDLWLNTPRRPREASGTSGMKVLPNGGLNASILDGWWDEAYDREVGWAIGAGEEYQDDHEYQDRVEAEVLYTLLEQQIVPLFYQRGPDGLPRGWIGRVKASMRRLAASYTTTRMVREYSEWMYLPAADDFRGLTADGCALARDLAGWQERVREAWPEARVESVATRREGAANLPIGTALEVQAEVSLGGLKPDEVAVELFCGPLDRDREIAGGRPVPMTWLEALDGGRHLYSGRVPTAESGQFGFAVRVLPWHEALANPRKLGLVRWQEGG